MRTLHLALIAAMIVVPYLARSEYYVHEYSLKLTQQVPKIFNNTQSKGFRQYTTQRLRGTMWIVYSDKDTRPMIFVTELVNLSHKLSNGDQVTYKVQVNNNGYLSGPMTRVNLIGNNLSDIFNRASVVFYMDAEPSYNKGEDDEDNSLLLTCAGKGNTVRRSVKVRVYQNKDKNGTLCSSVVDLGINRIINSLSGYDAGTLGCGCHAYGHKSPTRVSSFLGHSDIVDDVASSYGTWRAQYCGSSCYPDDYFD